MEAQQKPEGLKRLQAGVKPLQKAKVTLAPKGRKDALPPLRGLATPAYLQGFHPCLWSQRPFGATPGDVYKE